MVRSLFSRVAVGAVALAALGLASGQSITIAISEGIQGFDPAGNNRTVASTVYPNIFDALVHKDAAGNMIPGLATSWEPVDADSWRIALREGVTWHDGQPFTAADVEFTIERIATTTELARNVLFAHVTDVEVVNDHEVLIHTEVPDPLMPGNLAANGAQIVPKHYYESAGVDAATVSPIGTGPYKFVEYRPDDRLVVEAYADYWGGVPVYQQATFRVIGENTTSVSELVTGGVQITGVSATDRQRVEESASTRLIIQPTNRVAHWTFNVSEDQVTSDPRVREAIDYAIDDALMLEILQDGFGTPTRVRSSPADSFAPLQYYDTYLYDPERAQEILAEAGYGPGEVHITLMGATSNADQAELTATMLEAVGMTTEVKVFESSVWSSTYWQTGEFTNMAAVGSSNSTFDYGNTLTDLMCPEGVHSFRSHWCHEEFSDLVRQANAEVNAERRTELLNAATEILLQERPQLYMFNTVNFMGISNDVEFEARADGHLLVFFARPASN
jgi:peptide/nickel transport system substrate-binding protein